MRLLAPILLLLFWGCSTSQSLPPVPSIDPRVGAVEPLLEVTSRAQPFISTAPSDSFASIVNYVPLIWEESDPSVASFNLYYSETTPTGYDHVQSASSLSCVISNMPVGATWYFAVTALDTNGNESDFSPQFVYTMPPMLDMGFHFDQTVTNISVLSSTDLITWGSCSAYLRSNGLWRVNIDSPAQFYRGVAQLQ